MLDTIPNEEEMTALVGKSLYNEAQTYHDGKWIMFEPVDTSLFHDFTKLLRIKRKPNRK